MNKLIYILSDLVENACRKDTNTFGYQIWSHHITQVVNFSIELSERLGSDKEIVIIAALLHDYASIKNINYYKEHHIYGANLAEEILSQYNYDYDKKELVKKCIFTHRGSFSSEKISKEQICVASADAMAHIDQATSLLYLAFCKKGMTIEQGNEWLTKKIDRSWNKLCNEAKSIINDKYISTKTVLGMNSSMQINLLHI